MSHAIGSQVMKKEDALRFNLDKLSDVELTTLCHGLCLFEIRMLEISAIVPPHLAPEFLSRVKLSTALRAELTRES